MRSLLFFLLLGQLIGRANGQSAVLTLNNPSDVARAETVVTIPWATVRRAYPQVDTTQLRITLLSSGQEVPYQLEHQGQRAIQNLLVQVSIGARGRVHLLLSRGKPAPITPKTYCRYVPERYDDFAWENDRVAFRIYGSALNGRSDNAYGTDIWAKRTGAMVLNNWYRQNDYHKDHGEGLDYYHVGLTLGAGDIGVFLNDSLQFIHNYRSWAVLDNGPLRSTFQVKFDPYRIKGITIHEVRTVTLDAGAQLSKVQVAVTHSAAAPLPMVVGITLRSAESPLLLDEKAGLLGYWEPQHGNDGTLGIGCVFTSSPVTMLKKYEHGLARLTVPPGGGTLTYYAGGAWDKAGLVRSADDWFGYLRRYASQLAHPVRIVATPSRPGRR